jgi:hypothetical protein
VQLVELKWLAAVAYVAGVVALVLRYPARSVHDRLTGVYLVPW